MKETIPKHQFSTKSSESFPLTLGQIEVLELHKTNMLNLSVEHEDTVFMHEAIEVNKFINNQINRGAITLL